MYDMLATTLQNTPQLIARPGDGRWGVFLYRPSETIPPGPSQRALNATPTWDEALRGPAPPLPLELRPRGAAVVLGVPAARRSGPALKWGLRTATWSRVPPPTLRAVA